MEATIQGFAFSPAVLVVDIGTTVRWTNKDGIGHTVTSQAAPNAITPSGVFDSNTLNLNDQFSFTFNQTGTFYYYCQPHGTSMQARVNVVPEPASAGAVVFAGGLLLMGRARPTQARLRRNGLRQG